jgi:hypothetical protein
MSFVLFNVTRALKTVHISVMQDCKNFNSVYC